MRWVKDHPSVGQKPRWWCPITNLRNNCDIVFRRCGACCLDCLPKEQEYEPLNIFRDDRCGRRCREAGSVREAGDLGEAENQEEAETKICNKGASGHLHFIL